MVRFRSVTSVFAIVLVSVFGTVAADTRAERVGDVLPGPYVAPVFAEIPTPDGIALYDNGPLVNSPGTGAGGADESVLQTTSLGMTSLGFGHQILNDNRVADDFEVTGPGWVIDEIWFYAYQTGSTTTSTMDAVHVRIWDGPPADPGSTVIFGDMTTNLLMDTFWSNIFRVTETTSGDTGRPIMAVAADVNIELPPGTYWLDWQVGGTLGSGPWAPPITINGEATTGNGLQSVDAGATYNPANDGGSLTQQGFPFVIFGDLVQTGYPVLGSFGFPVPPSETPIGLDHNGGGNLLVTDIGTTKQFFLMDTATPTANLLAGPEDVSATSLNPIGITHDGINLYVTDTNGDDVDVYDGSGNYLASFPVDAHTTFPEGIAWNSLDGYLYVVNGSFGNVVHKFTTAGTWIEDFPVLGSSQDGIAWDPVRESFWIYDSDTDTIRQYDTTFNQISSSPGTFDAGFSNGEGLAVIGDAVFICAFGDQMVVIFDISGAPVSSLIFSDRFETGDDLEWSDTSD